MVKTLIRPVMFKVHPRRKILTKASVDPVELSKTLGKGITLWVLFTSSLNWLYYRNKTKK